MNLVAGPPTSGGPVAASPRAVMPAFQLSLPGFEGPIELLLRLSEHDKLDITTVSLVQVTNQYLAHFRSQSVTDVPGLADFVAMAARLLLLKSRSLLPRGAPIEVDDEPEPFDDLGAALREYVLYRVVADEFSQRTRSALHLFPRAVPQPEMPPARLKRIGLDDLIAAMEGILSRLDDKPAVVELAGVVVSVADKIQTILTDVAKAGIASFFALAARCTTRTEVLVTFLAILHLVRDGALTAEQPEAFGEILLRSSRAGAGMS
jgi:segregation and condensation protein A